MALAVFTEQMPHMTGATTAGSNHTWADVDSLLFIPPLLCCCYHQLPPPWSHPPSVCIYSSTPQIQQLPVCLSGARLLKKTKNLWNYTSSPMKNCNHKSWRNQICLVPRFSKLRDASHGSHRVVGPMLTLNQQYQENSKQRLQLVVWPVSSSTTRLQNERILLSLCRVSNSNIML